MSCYTNKVALTQKPCLLRVGVCQSEAPKLVLAMMC